MEGVFFFHRSLTPTARETFLSFLSHVFVPSLTSLLSLSIFCTCELVQFASAVVRLSAFLRSEPSAQELFLSLL